MPQIEYLNKLKFLLGVRHCWYDIGAADGRNAGFSTALVIWFGGGAPPTRSSSRVFRSKQMSPERLKVGSKLGRAQNRRARGQVGHKKHKKKQDADRFEYIAGTCLVFFGRHFGRYCGLQNVTFCHMNFLVFFYLELA